MKKRRFGPEHIVFFLFSEAFLPKNVYEIVSVPIWRALQHFLKLTACETSNISFTSQSQWSLKKGYPSFFWSPHIHFPSPKDMNFLDCRFFRDICQRPSTISKAWGGGGGMERNGQKRRWGPQLCEIASLKERRRRRRKSLGGEQSVVLFFWHAPWGSLWGTNFDFELSWERISSKKDWLKSDAKAFLGSNTIWVFFSFHCKKISSNSATPKIFIRQKLHQILHMVKTITKEGGGGEGRRYGKLFPSPLLLLLPPP